MVHYTVWSALKKLGKRNLIFLDLNTLEKLASKGKNTLPESQETPLGSLFTIGTPLPMLTLPRVITILASHIVSLLIYVIHPRGLGKLHWYKGYHLKVLLNCQDLYFSPHWHLICKKKKPMPTWKACA